LADEIATALGSAGHLATLSRHRSGPFYLKDALDMPTLARLVAGEVEQDWKEVLMSRKRGEDRVKWRARNEVVGDLTAHMQRPIHALAHLPLADLSPDEARRVRNGAAPSQTPAGVSPGEQVLLVSGDEVVAVGQVTTFGVKVLRVVGA
jgi:tRNA U55 pseudouridine synthase TruB